MPQAADGESVEVQLAASNCMRVTVLSHVRFTLHVRKRV